MGLRRQTEAKYWKVKWGRHYDHAAYLELLRAFATDIWGGGGQATARWIWNQVRLNARKFKLSKRDIRWMAKHLGGIMRIPTKGLYVKLAFLTYKNQACTNKWCCWGRFGLKCGFSCRRCGMHVISQTPNTHHLYLAIGRIARRTHHTLFSSQLRCGLPVVQSPGTESQSRPLIQTSSMSLCFYVSVPRLQERVAFSCSCNLPEYVVCLKGFCRGGFVKSLNARDSGDSQGALALAILLPLVHVL